MATTTTQTARDAKKRVVMLLVGALVLILGAYGSGLGQGMRAARQAREAQRAAEARLGVAEATIRPLEARRQLHLTLMALEESNFGIARAHLSAAAILLAHVSAPESGGLSALARQIKTASVLAPEEFARQHDAVLDFARRLDALIPPSSLPGHGLEAP